MFADDTTLFAKSKTDLMNMIKDVQSALGTHGLNLNFDKCLVQTNNSDATVRPIELDGQ